MIWRITNIHPGGQQTSWLVVRDADQSGGLNRANSITCTAKLSFKSEKPDVHRAMG